MGKPLTPRAHGATDYAVMATLLTAPKVLHMSRRARTVFGGIGLNVGAVNALTAQPLNLKSLIPFKVHQKIDLAAVPTYALIPVLAHIHKEPKARALWLATLAGLVATYALTDWDAAGE